MFRISTYVVIPFLAFALIASIALYELVGQQLLSVHAVNNNNLQHSGKLVKPHTDGEWGTYQGDLGRSGFNAKEAFITPTSAPFLKAQWTYQAGGSISSQPVESNGLIYWGSWDGYEHATNLNGQQVWATNLGQAQGTKCSPKDAGVAGAATVASVSMQGKLTSVVFIAGGTAHFYALNALTGAILWDTTLGSSPDHMLWGGSAVFQNSVYVGLSSYGDCPLVQGELIKLNIATGAIEKVFTVVPGGCVGGGIWSSPTIDETSGILYISTGTDALCPRPETLAVGLIALKASDLSYISSWQVPVKDRVYDSDFGSTPTLFSATIRGSVHTMIGLVNKDGDYYALDRTRISAGAVWKTHISDWERHHGKYSIASSAWDGKFLYVGGAETTISSSDCKGSISALNPANGAFVWRICLSGHVMAAVTAVPGVVVVGAGDSIIILNATTGNTLFNFQDTHSGSIFWGPASISNGVLYEGNGDGTLYAFVPQQGGSQ